MLFDLIASLSFYFVPYLAGRFFTKNIVQAWIGGALILFLLYFGVKGVTGLFGLSNFPEILRILVSGISIASIGSIALSAFKSGRKPDLSRVLPISLTLIFVSVIYFVLWRADTPYALQMNWDMYEHITLANEISEGNLSFLTSKISDTFTFDSYSPLFAILLSIPKIIFQKNLLGVYFWLEYWHYLLSAAAVFLIARKVFNNNLLSVLAAIISSLTFESLMVYTTLFLVPQTLVALIMAHALVKIEEYRLRWLFLLITSIFLIHYIVGVLCIAVLIAFYLAKRLSLSKRVLNTMLVGSILALLFSISLNVIGQWELLSRAEAQYFTFSLIEKAKLYLGWYGAVSIALMILGSFKIIRSGGLYQKLILISALFALAVSLAPFSYFLKFQVVGHYLTVVVIVAGTGVLLSSAPKLTRLVVVPLIIATLICVFYVNQLIFKEPSRFGGFNTNISPKEIEAARWLSFYGNRENTLIISDPSLQYVLEAVSGVNSPGGAYMNSTNRKLLSNIASSNNPIFIKENVLKIKDSVEDEREVFFVVGGRYFAWQTLSPSEKDSIFYNVWTPKKTKQRGREYIQTLKQSPEFEAVYENDEVVILKVI